MADNLSEFKEMGNGNAFKGYVISFFVWVMKRIFLFVFDLIKTDHITWDGDKNFFYGTFMHTSKQYDREQGERKVVYQLAGMIV